MCKPLKPAWLLDIDEAEPIFPRTFPQDLWENSVPSHKSGAAENGQLAPSVGRVRPGAQLSWRSSPRTQVGQVRPTGNSRLRCSSLDMQRMRCSAHGK